MSKAPHIVWPAAINGLLLLSVITTFAILWASQSDGGAQVVNDYYRKSVAWDSVSAARDASERLGWSLNVNMDAAIGSGYGTFAIADEGGSPVLNLTGSVSVTRPQSAALYGTFDLMAVDRTPGSYRFEFPFSGRGLWDLDFRVRSVDLSYSRKVRVEI